MREDLKKQVSFRVYKLTEDDFDGTIRLTHNFVNTRLENLKQEILELEKRDEDVEVISDIGYYTHLECAFLWHFCLWRLQGILEGMITETFLPSVPQQPLFGLKAKLNAMETVGYTIDQKDYDELIEWGNLRNNLSHFPPEHYRPGFLVESDISEYKELLNKVCAQWRKERAGVWHPEIIDEDTDHYARKLD